MKLYYVETLVDDRIIAENSTKTNTCEISEDRFLDEFRRPENWYEMPMEEKTALAAAFLAGTAEYNGFDSLYASWNVDWFGIPSTLPNPPCIDDCIDKTCIIIAEYDDGCTEEEDLDNLANWEREQALYEDD